MHADPGSGTVRDQILLLRGRAGLTQRALAAHLGLSTQAIQKWEAGEGYPSPARLQALIALYLQRGVFTAGREEEEARALWAALRRAAGPRTPPFDGAWFASLRPAAPEVPAPAPPPPLPVGAPPAAPEPVPWQAWGEAPDVAGFQGRQAEVETLRHWLVQERCRVVALLGLGGIGKTALATHTARELAPHFAGLCWRSLRNAPPPEEWLGAAIGALAPTPPVLPAGLSARQGLLLEVLRARRCLLVLDNLETVLEPGAAAPRYRAGYEGYGAVLRQIGESAHKSALLLTGREAPPELAVLAAAAPVRTLRLGGMDPPACRALLQGKGLVGDDAAWQGLVSRYGGNPLALNLIGRAIVELFGGDIAAWLAYAVETFGVVFGGLRRLLEEQFGRLSPLEQSLLYWLAVEREPVGVAALRADLAAGAGPGMVLEVLGALGQRSLLERGAERATHTLQPVVLEYVGERLVEALAQEVMTGRPALLVSHAVVQATSKDYVRRSQERLLAQPLVERVVAAGGGADEAERQLVELVQGWRGRPWAEQGYGPGNVVNLLRLLRGDLRGLDLSRLAIRQAYLQGVEAQDASLAGAHLTEAVLGEAFAYPTCVALSADGAYLAAGTPTGEVFLWRVADRTLRQALQGHTGGVWGVALCADGQLVASASYDGTVKLWEAGSARLLATLRGHTGGVRRVALSGDGRLLASASEDGTVRLWDAASGRLRASLQGHTSAVRGVALSADGQLVASGSFDGVLRLWETGSGQVLTTLHGHTGAVPGVALSGDGHLMASASQDGTVKLWEAESGRLRATLHGHTGGLLDVALSGDGRLLASGGEDGTVRLWDAASGRLRVTLQGHSGAVLGVALSGDGGLVASGSWDGAVKLWEAEDGRLLASVQGRTRAVRCVALSADGQLVANGSQDGTVRLWDAASGRLRVTLQGHTSGVRGLALSGDGRLVASSSWDGTVRLWEAEDGRLRATVQGHTGLVPSVALSGDGRLLASGSRDGAVKLWDTGSGQLLTTLDRHSSGVWGVALSGDGGLLASGSWDGAVKLWDTGSGRLLMILQGHTGAVRGVALSGDGRLVASGSFDGTVRLWEASSGACLHTLRADRRYERLDITGLTGVTEAQRAALLALGAFDGQRAPDTAAAPG